MAKEKKLNINEFKSLVKKLIKEELKRATATANSDSEKTVTNSLKESVLDSKKKLVILEHRRKTISNILMKEESWFDKLRGTVNPSVEVDNPKYVRKNIESALAKATKFANDFNEKTLATSAAINAYHEAVTDALDKLVLLTGDQTWMPEMKKEFEAKIIDAAKTFYRIMNNEKGRIESFTKTIMNDLQDKGFDKSYLTVDKKTKTPDFKVSTPSDVEDNKLIDKAISAVKGAVKA